MQLNIDVVIQKLLNCRNQRPGKFEVLTYNQIQILCVKSSKIFLQQQSLIKLNVPIKICGDIHGQYADIFKLFQRSGFPDNQKYLFLGDYVDRGQQSIQTICLLLSYKIKYPQTFFMLRGNHQSSFINKNYGFYDQIKRRHNIKLWKIFNSCFNCIPIAALIQNKILCMHGGISPQLTSLKQINQIKRPTQIPQSGLLCDLLWSDPKLKISGWQLNQRGISYSFGKNVIQRFLNQHQLDLICRAHQVVQQGYQFFADRKLVTIFSAPNYCNQYNNCGAVMFIKEGFICSFLLFFSSLEQSSIKKANAKRPTTPPINILKKKQ